MATNDEYAMLSGPVPEGFAVYQLPGVQLGDHTYYGWRMVKQKSETYTDEDGKEQTRQVDDDTAVVAYDENTQLLQVNSQQAKEIANLKAANDLTQQGLMEAVDYLSAQVAGKTTATDTGSTVSNSAVTASSAAQS